MKVHQLIIALYTITLLAIPACKEPPPVLPDVSLNGTVINRVTGEGIPNVKLELQTAGWSGGVVVGTSRTSEDGSFKITGERNIDFLVLPDYRRTYQTPMHVNGEVKKFHIRIGSAYGAPLGSPFEIELYPKPVFFLDFVKKPGSSVDSVIVNLKNVDLGVSQHDIKTIDIPGDTARYGIHGFCHFENILEVEYYVAGNGSGRSYNTTFECEPGKTTTFKIEYGF